VRAQCRVEITKRGGQFVAERGDELGRVQRLAEPLVMAGPVLVKIGRQIDVWVAPTHRAHDPHLSSADRLTQRGQHAQLVGDPLHPRAAVLTLVDHRGPPVGRHDPVQRHVLRGGVEADIGAVGVAAHQRQRLDHRRVTTVR
jgi:hypothetical protein